jgi:SAM-dependent methyltransferase
MIETCPVCGSAEVEVRGEYHGTHTIFTGLKRAHCCSCGMAFASPVPNDAALDEYNASYFTSAHGGQPQNSLATAFFSGIARLRLAHLKLYLDNKNISVSRVLELGPGPGFFARNLLEEYPETTYMAFETDTSCHASLQEMGVHVVAASDLFEDNDPVDLVIMSHVLEHVVNPFQFLTDATRNLRDGGALFIEVPCRDWEHKPTDEPHLLFFDKGPMLHLLSTLGFHNIQVSYHGQEIDRLRSASPWRSKLMALRSKLIALGLVAPFSRVRPGMETLTDPLERAMLAPFNAHRETQKPAWWLRVLAIKKIRE